MHESSPYSDMPRGSIDDFNIEDKQHKTLLSDDEDNESINRDRISSFDSFGERSLLRLPHD